MQKLNKLNRGIVVLSLLAFVGVVGCSDSDTVESGSPMLVALEIEGTTTTPANLMAGAATYESPCTNCHGADGTGRGGVNDIAFGAGAGEYVDFDALVLKIDTSMPPSDPSSCQGDCARDVAAHVMCTYNSQLVTSGCPAP
jgi:mono/diheme cytochrome c family protein